MRSFKTHNGITNMHTKKENVQQIREDDVRRTVVVME